MKGSTLTIVAFLLAACCLLFPPASAAEDNPDMPPGLAETIDAAIKMLESEQYAGFLKTYAYPKDLEKITENVSLDQLAVSFADGKASVLLDALKKAADSKPEVSSDGMTATFKVIEKRKLVFVNMDGRWYIKD
jgi:hypothetical protein